MSPSKLKLTLRNPLNTIKYKTAVTESVQGPSVLVVLLLFECDSQAESPQ